jgi:hypothetical protein
MGKPSEASGNGRGPRGHYAPGNPGGPGRPPRAIESDYLRTLADACPPDTWREICDRAVEQARDGDAKARDWLAGHLLGLPRAEVRALTELAAHEAAGYDPVASRAADFRRTSKLDELLAQI